MNDEEVKTSLTIFLSEVTLKIDRNACISIMDNLRKNGMYKNLIHMYKTNNAPQHLITNSNDEAIQYWNIIGKDNKTKAKIDPSCHAILHQDTTEIYNIGSNTLEDFEHWGDDDNIILYDFLTQASKESSHFGVPGKLYKAFKESELSEIDPELQKNVSISLVKRVYSPIKIALKLPDFRCGDTMDMIKHGENVGDEDQITSEHGETILNINYHLDDSLNGLASTAKPGDLLVFNLDNSVYFIHQDSDTCKSYEILDTFNSLTQAIILPTLIPPDADGLHLKLELNTTEIGKL